MAERGDSRQQHFYNRRWFLRGAAVAAVGFPVYAISLFDQAKEKAKLNTAAKDYEQQSPASHSPEQVQDAKNIYYQAGEFNRDHATNISAVRENVNSPEVIKAESITVQDLAYQPSKQSYVDQFRSSGSFGIDRSFRNGLTRWVGLAVGYIGLATVGIDFDNWYSDRRRNQRAGQITDSTASPQIPSE